MKTDRDVDRERYVEIEREREEGRCRVYVKDWVYMSLSWGSCCGLFPDLILAWLVVLMAHQAQQLLWVTRMLSGMHIYFVGFWAAVILPPNKRP